MESDASVAIPRVCLNSAESVKLSAVCTSGVEFAESSRKNSFVQTALKFRKPWLAKVFGKSTFDR